MSTKKYALLIIIAVILGALPLFVQYGDYLMSSDYATQLIPFIYESKRMFASGTPFWSWNTYYGDNFLGAYSYYTVSSPFMWLLCILPYKWIIKGCFVVLVVKYICAFLASRLYLRKMGVTRETRNVGALLYTFSSYAICNTFYYFFMEPIIVFPLLLLAVERYLRHERHAFTGLVLASFLTVLINYYFAVSSFLVALIYIICRLFSHDIKVGPRRIVLGVVAVLLGMALDAVMLLPTAMHMTGGPRTTQFYSGFWGIRADLTYGFERMRLLFIPEIQEQPTTLFRGALGWESRSICLPVLGMLPVLLYCWHHRRTWLTLLAVVLLALLVTPLNSMFSMFTNPLYTRWAYALTLVLSLVSCKWIDERGGVSLRQTKWYVLLVLAVFGVALLRGLKYEPMPEALPAESRGLLLAGYVLLLAISLLFLFLYARMRKATVLAIGIAVVAVVQMALFHTIRSDAYFERVQDKKVLGALREYLVDNKLPRHDGDTHFRTLFWSGWYHNVPMLTNRAAVNSFHSIQNNVIRRLMCSVDSTNAAYRVAAGENCNRRSFYALMGVREVVAYDGHVPQSVKEELRLTLKEHGQGYDIYKNLDGLPMGFTYDSYVPEALIDTLNASRHKPDIPMLILANLAAPADDEAFFAKYLKKGEIALTASLDSILAERRKCVVSSFNGTTSGFTSQVTLPKDDIVFYSCPADKGFSAYVDGQPASIHPCNLGLSAVLVPKGKHIVEFRFVPRGLKEGAVMSLAVLLFVIVLFLMEKRRE